jgi:probable F420-dependent oxidoreductase
LSLGALGGRSTAAPAPEATARQAGVKRASRPVCDNWGTDKEVFVRIGVQLAQIGRLADASAVRRAVAAAEQVGFDSVWVLDRLLAPDVPRSAYPGTPDGALPDGMATMLDPLGVLTYAAAITDRVRLGTSVLVAPWYRPVALARMLTTIDQLSNGRLVVGLGVGWSVDEYEAAGVPMSARGALLDETLDVLDAMWGDEPARYEGATLRITRCDVRPKPVQRPRPPVLLAAYTPAGLDRVARRADGWNPAGLPIELLAPMWAQLRDAAASYGRDPDALSLVVRANITLTDLPVDGARESYHGSLAQVGDDLVATAAAGADEVILSLYGDPKLDEALDVFARLAEHLS